MWQPPRQQQQQQHNNKMKLTHNTKLKPGMTLIELTVVIIVLLTLISVLFLQERPTSKHPTGLLV
jgi:prepilin-type N-terminal cleavage/methylation domain-containing protein